MHANANYG
jgi:paired amphipathic helix protein Sin3a